MLVPSDSICQVSSDSMSIVRCHISGVRYQVLSNNMSSTGVIYQVSSITCQVPVSDINCQVSGVKCRCQVSSVKYQVSSITCQVPVSGIKYQINNMSVKVTTSCFR